MSKVDIAIINCIKDLTSLFDSCNLFRKEANIENGEKIIEKVGNCERNYLILKSELAKMVQSEDEKQRYISAIQDETESINKMIQKGKENE